MRRAAGLLALALVAQAAPAQTALRGVVPGESDVDAVARALGPPLRVPGPALAEHASGDPGAKLFVQYRDGVVARVELAWPAGRARDTLSGLLGVGSARAREARNELGRLEERYDTAAVVVTYRGDSAATPVLGAGFYSRALYDETFGREPSLAPPRPPDADAEADERYLGCFRDTPDFDLDGFLERSPRNTPARCIATCAQKDFAYAGVQYGESCLCGNSYGRYGAATHCDYPCTGDGALRCGGYNANGVYRTGAATAR